MNTVNIGIVGITGYTGEELLNILARHRGVRISVLAGREGGIEKRSLKEVYPHFAHLDLRLEPFDAAQLTARADVIFLALPHRVSFGIVPDLVNAGKKVIDLSADFRLANAAIYEKWYGEKHTAHALLSEAVYGLPEIYREKIQNARLVANPGCYPTTIILGLAPAITGGLVDVSSIIVDAKSGVSGAGRKAVQEYYQKEHPNVRPYNIGGTHRHIPEIEQELTRVADTNVTVTFTPHIIPVERGMLSTIYCNLKEKAGTAEIVRRYQEFYAREAFVRVLPEGQLPDLRNVTGTNFCDIGLKVDERTNRLIVASAIDNLIKGASGQAVQNMNIVMGFDEKEALL